MWARKAKHSVELAVLPAIQARTLLVHNTGAALFDAESVRAAAKLIPDARCAELAGTDALPYVGDADALLDVIQEFLTGTHGTPDPDRSLATVLFTDIVGSTHMAGQLGGRRWSWDRGSVSPIAVSRPSRASRASGTCSPRRRPKPRSTA